MIVIVIHVAIFIALGILAGFLAGLLGIGGGIVVVPGLVFLFHQVAMPHQYQMHMAAATSLAAMIFTTQGSVRAHQKIKPIRWEIYRRMAVGIAIGAVSGAVIANLLPTEVLRVIFGVVVLVIAVHMWRDVKPKATQKPPPTWVTHVVSYVIGFKSGMLGIGGGALTFPYLTRCKVSIKEAVAVTAVCSFTVAVVGTLSTIVTGWHKAGLPHWSTGYVYWPAAIAIALGSMLFAPMGARFSQRMPEKKLKRVFAAFLVFVGINMLT